MKEKLLILFSVFAICGSYAQKSVWSKTDESQATSSLLPRDSSPQRYLLYALDLDALKSKLQTAPSRESLQPSNTVVGFPTPTGEIKHFRIYGASVLHPDLAARHPGIKSYVGKCIDEPSATIRFSVTLFGLHTMTFSGENGVSYIDPYTKDLKNYIVYSKSALRTNKVHYCGFADNREEAIDIAAGDIPTHRSSNSLFKTYRLALACTIEYAAFHVNAAGLNAGTIQQKKDAVLAAMNVTMTRVNGVFENDLALTMVIIPNNEDIINIVSDNLDNNNSAPDYPLLGQNQTETDAVIGAANYDIGHVCTTGGGGVATLNSPCTGGKARGVTGLPSPVGDPYDIDYVSHEMGHQYGGNHTFNSDQGACNGNRTTSSAFEPGSGSTIMSYSGICAPDNIQFFSDAYFHARSLIQMEAFINGTGNCAAAVNNGNTPPTVSAGSNYTIPFGTAFILRASAEDIDNPTLTYCWEQYNAQISEQPPLPVNTVGPNFRSIAPSLSPNRYFPKLSDVIANNLTPTWEVIPNVARSMVFSLVVRDNQVPFGGQTQRSTMTLTYANVGPFKVTSQNTLEAWQQGSSQSVTWDVAGTDSNGINTALVNIKMSTDGGLTYPFILAENTLNDGNEIIVAPDTVSQTCRLMVESVGNIFYALNSTPFAVGYQLINDCQTYTYDTPFSLPDGSTAFTVKTINVAQGGTISDVNFTINATHPNLQNLVMAALRPGGPLSTYFNQQCAGQANMNVTFDAQGNAFDCQSPTQGTYIPPTGFNLNSFNGYNPQGAWQFGFKDVVAGDVGMINSITLQICSQLLLASSAFEFENFALYPNPNNGDFTVRLNSKSNNKINISVHDMRGRKIFDKNYNNTGLFSRTIELENAQSGIYIVSIADGEKKILKRIIID